MDRAQEYFVTIFHAKYPESPPIPQGTVTKIEKEYRELGHKKCVPEEGILSLMKILAYCIVGNRRKSYDFFKHCKLYNYYKTVQS